MTACGSVYGPDVSYTEIGGFGSWPNDADVSACVISRMGTRMSGRMGSDRVTLQNLSVHKVDAENGLLLIKGAIPGRNGAIVIVKSAVKGGARA